MPKNSQIIDYKPVNSVVLDYKPKNSSVLDYKSKNNTESSVSTTDQLYQVTLAQGAPMGLLLALTYNTNITVMNPKSP